MEREGGVEPKNKGKKDRKKERGNKEKKEKLKATDRVVKQQCFSLRQVLGDDDVTNGLVQTAETRRVRVGPREVSC